MKDKTYCALFAKEDLPSIYRMAEKVRSGSIHLSDTFNQECERRWNDQRNTIYPFLEVNKSDDLVVTAGLNFMVDQILGATTTRWRYMANGTDGGLGLPLAISNTTLGAESGSRIDMTTFGWSLAAGLTLRFAGIFGESVPTITVTECGVFTASSAGTMLNRNLFGSNFTIVHTINITGYVISSVVEFLPIVST